METGRQRLQDGDGVPDCKTEMGARLQDRDGETERWRGRQTDHHEKCKWDDLLFVEPAP